MAHQKIEEQIQLDGFDSDVDPETFTELQRVKFILSSPVERVQGLQHLSAAISADDGTSLRAKADLFDLHRKLSLTHEQLIKARR
jgi:hypothetical protein